MRLIERTEKFVVDSEEEAIKLIQNSKEDAEKNGYILGASGYTYKTKKAKGGQWNLHPYNPEPQSGPITISGMTTAGMAGFEPTTS